MINKNNYSSRKPTRLRNFDYSTPGSYFITICTQSREKLLSEVVGDGLPIPPMLTHPGVLVDESIRQIKERYASITVDNYIIMPNHIHLLLSVESSDDADNSKVAVDSVIGWLKYDITKKINEFFRTPGQKRFQRSFHDHIIRDINDYERINEYIEYNYLKWSKDCFYVD